MNIKNFFKGIIIGIAKIIPGLSGAVLMISFNLYDKAIESITNFFNNPKENFKFLLNLSLGIIIGIICFSNILNYLITNYYSYTTSLFVGLILGGIPILINNTNKDKKDYTLIIISFTIMTIISSLSSTNNYVVKNNYKDLIIYFIAGLLEATGTVLPGISSTALLMLLGVYKIFLTTIGNIYSIENIIKNLTFLIPFSLGLTIGIILLTILVNYLFKNHKETTYSLIIGIALSSVCSIVISIIKSINNITILPICLLIFLIGYNITKRL